MPDDDLIDLMGTPKNRESGSDKSDPEESDGDESESERLYPEAYNRDSFSAFFVGVAAFFVPSGVVFFSLKDRPGGMEIAAVVGYTLAIPYALSNRFLSHVPWDLLIRFRQKFLLMHCLALAVVCGITTLAFAIKPRLPEWFVVEGRKGSLFDLSLILSLLALALWEGSWISGHKGKRGSEVESR